MVWVPVPVGEGFNTIPRPTTLARTTARTAWKILSARFALGHVRGRPVSDDSAERADTGEAAPQQSGARPVGFMGSAPPMVCHDPPHKEWDDNALAEAGQRPRRPGRLLPTSHEVRQFPKVSDGDAVVMDGFAVAIQKDRLDADLTGADDVGPVIVSHVNGPLGPAVHGREGAQKNLAVRFRRTDRLAGDNDLEKSRQAARRQVLR